MRAAVITLLCFLASVYTVNAQKFSLLPQVGFENSKTNISYNNLSSFSPAGIAFSPQASLRLTYTSKHGDGFFLGVASSAAIINFGFTDPQNGMNNFSATGGNMQLRLEGGYQFNSKPISLNNKKQTTAKSSGARSGACLHCCRRNNAKQSPLNGRKGSWVRIQPSIGMGYIPFTKTDVVTTTANGLTSYEYRAGNLNTALIAGTGFEFGRNNARLFTVSINYMKGIGNLGNQTITSSAEGKSITTNLQSSVSAWSLKVGIPFTLGSKNSSSSFKKGKSPQHRPCMRYRSFYHF
jgi:hypothetical protein